MKVRDVVTKIPTTGKKLKQKEYGDDGPYPVVDQGQAYVAGYSHRNDCLIEIDEPVIVFGDHTRTVKVVHKSFIPGADGIKVLQPLKAVSARFLGQMLYLLTIDLVNKGYARHYQYLEKTSFYLPPLVEQHRIVAKIEELFSELDKGVESLRTARAQLKTYRHSLLKAAFEGRLTEQWRRDNADKFETADQLLNRIREEREARYHQQLNEWKEAVAQWQESDKTQPKPKKPRPANALSSLDDQLQENLPELPDEWSWQSIENLVECSPNAIKAGPFGSALKKEVYVPSGYKVYGQEQVINGDPDYGDYFVDQKKYQELSACAVKPRDVLISLVGTIGKVLILPSSTAEGVINPRLVKLSLNESVYMPEFFRFYFESKFMKSLYHQVSQGTTMNVLNLGIIKWLPYPLCSKEEQREIVSVLHSRLSEVDYLDKEIGAAIARSEALRQSILKRAFEGKLVPQDPDDEPASALLERIRAEQEEAPKPRGRRRKAGA